MQVVSYYSDDYAGLEAGSFEFYYGYEVTEKGEDGRELWCFQVKHKGKEVFRATYKEIEPAAGVNSQLHSDRDYLLVGIGMWIVLKADIS